MPLSPEQIEKFKKIAEFITLESGFKLSSLINRSVTLEYKGFVDSLMAGEKIAIKKDCFLVDNKFENTELGPISLIVSNPQVFTIADLVMGGDGVSNEATKPDETNQMVYAETLTQVLKSLFSRFQEHVEGEDIQIGDHGFRELISIKDASLVKPEGVEDPIAVDFSIKVSAKLDDVIHVEFNSKLVENIIEKFDSVIESLDPEEFRKKVKAEYLPEEESEEEERIVEEDDGTDDAYVVNEKRNLSILTDINLDLVVELGRSEMTFDQLLNLTKGSAIELERQCSDPVDLYVHNQLIAKGEVVAIDDCFGLKITEVLGDLKLADKMGLVLK